MGAEECSEAKALLGETLPPAFGDFFLACFRSSLAGGLL